jgi:hypothetical protein
LGYALKSISWREFLVNWSSASFKRIAVLSGVGVIVRVKVVIVVETMVAGVPLSAAGVRGVFFFAVE